MDGARHKEGGAAEEGPGHHLVLVAGVGVATGDGPGRKWCAVLPSPGLYIKLGPCQLALPPPGARWGQAQSSSTYST